MATFKEYARYDGLGLGELIRAGQVSAQEVLDAAIEQAERVNPRINAICLRDDALARRVLAAGAPQGPFGGVPLLLKDLGAEAIDLPASRGSRFFRGETTSVDSNLIARYRRAGFVLWGRTTSPELGMCPSTEAAVYGGPTRNPWNLEHSAGGSSGGAGASVAARIVPIAQASDGAGSIRIPGAACGLLALKPTRARTPAGPHIGEGWGGLAIEHVVSRSVRDSAAALDATQGPDAGTPYFAPPVERAYLEEAAREPGRLRIAFLKTTFDGSPIHAEIAAAVEDVARLLASLGHELAEDRPAFDNRAMLGALIRMMAAAAALAVRERSRQLGREPRDDELEPATWGALELAQTTTATDYLGFLNTLHRVGRDVAPFFERYDVLLTPVFSRHVARLGEVTMAKRDFVAYRTGPGGVSEYSAWTPLANVTGQPAMSVPLAWSREGLPIGIQLVGRFGDEATLIRLGAQLEQARPWRDRLPPILSGS
jgi:amidase